MARWNEKFEDYTNALNRLSEAVAESIENPGSSTIKDGVIQRFEFTYELCWRLMKAYLEFEGIENANSPRSVFREAFKIGLIDDEWIQLLEDRNLTTHTYSEDNALKIYKKIKENYLNRLKAVHEKLENIEGANKCSD